VPENSILRPRQAWQRINVGKSNFHQNYVFKEGGPAYLPGTDIPRLKPVKLGPRARGFFNDEVAELIENLRRFRDGDAGLSGHSGKSQTPRKTDAV
jgi:hypothetical protein